MTPLGIAAIVAAVALVAPHAQAQGCPPGLAKKSAACIPPGLAKKGGPALGRGDILPDGYVLVRDWDRYRLPPLGPGEQYYRIGDRILRVDADTRRILDAVALTASLLD